VIKCRCGSKYLGGRFLANEGFELVTFFIPSAVFEIKSKQPTSGLTKTLQTHSQKKQTHQFDVVWLHFKPQNSE
jgi:hypothetical protein